MLETYLDEKVHLSSKIWLSEVEKPMIFHDFPANSLCNLHREFEGNHHFFNYHRLYLRAEMDFFIQISF